MANLLKHGWQQEEKTGDDALPGKMEKHAPGLGTGSFWSSLTLA
jgi:hypothetical protein